MEKCPSYWDPRALSRHLGWVLSIDGTNRVGAYEVPFAWANSYHYTKIALIAALIFLAI